MRKARNVVHALAVIMIVFSPQVIWAQESCTDICHAVGMEEYNARLAENWSERRATAAGARAWGGCMIATPQGVQ